MCIALPLTLALVIQTALALLAPYLIEDTQSQRYATHGALSVGLIAWTYFKDSHTGFRRASFWAILGACIGLLPPLVVDVLRTIEAHLVSVAGVFAVVAYTRMASFFAVNAYQGAFRAQNMGDELSPLSRALVCALSAAVHWGLYLLR